MGNRDDLLAGARRCLYSKGYSRTTARDIATEAGTSLAAIGYHFGSVQALLSAAMVQTMSELADSQRDGRRQTEGSPVERLAAVLADTIAHHLEHRQLWLASREAAVAAEHSPEIRAELVKGLGLGRRGMAAEVLDVDEDTVDEEAVRTVGAFGMCLLDGLRYQLPIEAQGAPSVEDVVAGMLRVLAPTGGSAGVEQVVGEGVQ